MIPTQKLFLCSFSLYTEAQITPERRDHWSSWGTLYKKKKKKSCFNIHQWFFIALKLKLTFLSMTYMSWTGSSASSLLLHLPPLPKLQSNAFAFQQSSNSTSVFLLFPLPERISCHYPPFAAPLLGASHLSIPPHHASLNQMPL